MVVSRTADDKVLAACEKLDDESTAVCTKIERDFLKALMGGCSTPISAYAQLKENTIFFEGNILSLDGKEKASVSFDVPINDYMHAGTKAAMELLNNGGKIIADNIRNAS